MGSTLHVGDAMQLQRQVEKGCGDSCGEGDRGVEGFRLEYLLIPGLEVLFRVFCEGLVAVVDGVGAVLPLRSYEQHVQLEGYQVRATGGTTRGERFPDRETGVFACF